MNIESCKQKRGVIALWTRYSQHCVNRFRSACHKCTKKNFGVRYSRRDSITQILLNYWSSYSFTTITHNAKQVSKQCIQSCPNSLILMFNSLQAGCVGCI